MQGAAPTSRTVLRPRRCRNRAARVEPRVFTLPSLTYRERRIEHLMCVLNTRLDVKIPCEMKQPRSIVNQGRAFECSRESCAYQAEIFAYQARIFRYYREGPFCTRRACLRTRTRTIADPGMKVSEWMETPFQNMVSSESMPRFDSKKAQSRK